MKFYIEVRAEAEKMIRESGMNRHDLRPWYVLGPGRRWPVLQKPMYWFMERIPARGNRRIGSAWSDRADGPAPLSDRSKIRRNAYESSASRDSTDGLHGFTIDRTRALTICSIVTRPSLCADSAWPECAP